MPAKVEISAPEVIVAPGSEEVLEAHVRNLGAVTDTFSVAPSGPGQGWTVVDPPLVTLFPGAEQTLRVSFRPPRSSTITAGEMTMTLRVVPQGDPDDVTTADALVRILAFDDRRLSIVQPVVRGRERAVFDIVVENDGNTRSTSRLSIVDPTNRVGARFEPPSVAVEPGGREVVRARVSARRQRFAGQPLPHLITVRATEEGHVTAQASSTFLQAALIPERIGRRLIALALLVGLGAATWFGVLRPAVDRAAEEAATVVVDERVAALQLELGQAPATSTTVPAEGAAIADAGESWDRQWTINAIQGDTSQTEPITVGDGRVLRITDVFWSNEAQDTGSVTLLRDGKVVLQWGLGSNRNWAQAFRNALEVDAGGNVAIQLVCVAPGDPTSTGCEVSFTLAGADAPAEGSS